MAPLSHGIGCEGGIPPRGGLLLVPGAPAPLSVLERARGMPDLRAAPHRWLSPVPSPREARGTPAPDLRRLRAAYVVCERRVPAPTASLSLRATSHSESVSEAYGLHRRGADDAFGRPHGTASESGQDAAHGGYAPPGGGLDAGPRAGSRARQRTRRTGPCSSAMPISRTATTRGPDGPR
jgi:hypothetical protein